MTLLLAIVVLAGLTAVSALFLWNLCLFRRAAPVSPHMPAVSILIPARDEAAEIEGAVRAACAQTAPDLEVIVLDDGSTDGTGAILSRLERELPRLRVEAGVPLPPGWAGKAWACWQLARIHARHPWVLFVDCDVRLEDLASGERFLPDFLAGEPDDFFLHFPRDHDDAVEIGEDQVPRMHQDLAAGHGHVVGHHPGASFRIHRPDSGAVNRKPEIDDAVAVPDLTVNVDW